MAKTLTASKNGKTAAVEEILIPPLKIDTFQVKVVGDSELITHAWSKKAIDMIEGKQQKRATGPREAKDPKAEYAASFYRTEDGKPGMPVLAFKSAAITACSQNLDLTKVTTRGAFHVVGKVVPVTGTPYMRTDMVRVGMGQADVRYRPGFPEWSCVLTIRHNPHVMTAAQIINLLNYAGFAVGVGEHRPEKKGDNGMFHCESV